MLLEDTYCSFLLTLWYKLYLFILQGLAAQAALSARERDGPNVLNPPDTVPIWIRVAGLFFGGLNLLLWMGAIMAFVQFLVQIGEYPTLQLDAVCDLDLY